VTFISYREGRWWWGWILDVYTGGLSGLKDKSVCNFKLAVK
jgi:hypothetical protein